MSDEQTNDFFLPPADPASAVPVDTAPVDYTYDYNPSSAYEYDDPGSYNAPDPEDGVSNMEPPASDNAALFPDENGVLVPETYDNDNDAPIILVPPPPVEVVSDNEGVEDASKDNNSNGAAILLEDSSALVASKSAMSAFNEEFQEVLKLRKEEENQSKAEAIAVAEKDLAVIAQQREAKREMKMSKNRSEEQSKLEAMEADLENDNSWQRVVKLVDLTQDGKESAQDTKRMREVFIVLKNDQNKAALLS